MLVQYILISRVTIINFNSFHLTWLACFKMKNKKEIKRARIEEDELNSANNNIINNNILSNNENNNDYEEVLIFLGFPHYDNKLLFKENTKIEIIGAETNNPTCKVYGG